MSQAQTVFTSSRSLSERFHDSWTRSRRTTVGMAVVAVIGLLALLAPVIAPYGTTEQNLTESLNGPSLNHLFGTDEFGQDVFSRVLYGGRPTLLIAGTTVLLAVLIGAPLGIIAGFFGGIRDLVIMRVVEFSFSLPALVLAITVIAFMGQGTAKVIIALTIVYAPLVARVARASTLTVRTRPFVLAARAIGSSNASIMVRQVVPNIAAPVLVQATLVFAYALLAEASLSFLGLGTQEPLPSWGRMLKEALALGGVAPWVGIFPGLFIAFAVIGLNLIGDGLRDVMDATTRNSLHRRPAGIGKRFKEGQAND
jgi:ABC-type dipeptide/oligopeptide/nickel transport system permease subunit